MAFEGVRFLKCLLNALVYKFCCIVYRGPATNDDHCDLYKISP